MRDRHSNFIGASRGITAPFATRETPTGKASPTVLIRTLTANRRLAVRNIVNALFVRDGMVLLARRSPHRTTYPALWSFPGGHVEHHETLTDALIRELREEVGVIPTLFSFLATILDPHTPESDPATYHMYAVSAWTGGEPTLLGDEHTELRWFPPTAAIALPDLALEEYRPLFKHLAGMRRRH